MNVSLSPTLNVCDDADESMCPCSTDFTMPLMRLVHREITLFGASIYPDTIFPEMCRFIGDHALNLDAVVSHTLPLRDGAEAFRLAETATTGKVMFSFD